MFVNRELCIEGFPAHSPCQLLFNVENSNRGIPYLRRYNIITLLQYFQIATSVHRFLRCILEKSLRKIISQKTFST